MEETYRLDLNNLPIELKLILDILQISDKVKSHQFSQELKDSNIDWEKFISLVYHHRIYPQVYTKLNKVHQALIPAQVIQRIENKYKKNTFNMLLLSAEMEYVSKMFESAEVKMLVLKGPVLAEDLYGDISLRTSNDLDILISISDLDRAEALLIKEGYLKDDYFTSILGEWRWRHHHVTYFHPVKKVKLELHWRLNPGPGAEPCFKDLWKRKRISCITKKPIYFLGREDLFLFLISHGARHGWSRLRWLVDIHQLVEQDIDWNQIFLLIKKYQLEKISGKVLILASNLLGTNIKKEMISLVSNWRSKELGQKTIFYFENMINLHSEPLPTEISKYHQKYLFSLKTIKQKWIFIVSFLYPYPEDASTLQLPKNLHILYFLLRPFLWCWRKTKRSYALYRGI
ncbi:nucleotidyltransferase family protein [Rossellomorea aquimaris]|uniref:nucleotidyltransferase domain-containing protein n=1 Tax=Rossellomorea aquimaris TaxID=189382 RepID=UPI001CD57C59|nr:nucleotidyltransferase family protein [Rossellomorea aquimaris]MCA1061485.1 nucleotidyltransferase family protein [Rossellomorea aquimaris]